jgi:hypothetical protein
MRNQSATTIPTARAPFDIRTDITAPTPGSPHAERWLLIPWASISR